MSGKVPPTTNPTAREKFAIPHGVSPEIWQVLDKQWEGNVAADLRKLNFVRNITEKYTHFGDYPADFCWRVNEGKSDLINNIDLELAEVRYGQIQGIASSKPSLWLILKHKGNEYKIGHSSKWSIFTAYIQILKSDLSLEDIISKDVPVHVVRTTQHESDTYLLLAMHAEIDEWGSIQSMCEGRLQEGDLLVVHLIDSHPAGQHRSAIWKVADD
ncbi:hypothetical protein BGW36DRAFT_426153 [Talaromyces proteolyticus]|uniref:Uncharacterized protein n=1 Tax=Talaromyces proteolyticus TaxID=1131652 RepID=A0AAD4Q1G3_9EURO|nr:uncharacterized protein BGW36DRAFT_426153 [Talaromyces proteolyticus]KAH8698445.1 hypothetical protein BGW36DRAFT_426153 [Talaromyces proteolyticus]